MNQEIIDAVIDSVEVPEITRDYAFIRNELKKVLDADSIGSLMDYVQAQSSME